MCDPGRTQAEVRAEGQLEAAAGLWDPAGQD